MSDKKPRRKIPRGLYCYKIKSVDTDGKLNINPCPYWSIKEDLPPQQNGYCDFIGSSDEDLDGGLLWDMCKECGIKT